MPVFGPPPPLVAMATDDRFKETPSSGLMFIHLLGVFRPCAHVHKETPALPSHFIDIADRPCASLSSNPLQTAPIHPTGRCRVPPGEAGGTCKHRGELARFPPGVRHGHPLHAETVSLKSRGGFLSCLLSTEPCTQACSHFGCFDCRALFTHSCPVILGVRATSSRGCSCGAVRGAEWGSHSQKLKSTIQPHTFLPSV